jgi:hypothetical protein
MGSSWRWGAVGDGEQLKAKRSWKWGGVGDGKELEMGS